ncbi:Prophage CP4-57 integrase [Kingella potus]|uniref:Prophage CP4-57 integrase n=1 Tax=Kingella potus TaxID=265175 RepID=A0A377R2U3_9NEIS|nr:integrase arm-type DNA-binding domain-containing protein [Kingella potus]UOO99843.1 integrase arm-type DNA-binding domain-containing protein [Kingella potus]STR03097.1 Prophage CP4-57 integrase [Kingella potus]
MPKTTAPLTDSQCKRLAIPESGTAQLADGGGLYLQAGRGGKSWRLRYYFNGRRDEMRLGMYPAVSLREARAKREEVRRLIGQGIDPKRHAQAEGNQASGSFEDTARRWHADQCAKPDKWTAGHARRVLRSLEIHVFPAIGAQPVDAIEPLRVLETLQRLEAAGKNDTARKVLDVVNQVFGYAVRLRLIPSNPAADLRTEMAETQQRNFAHLSDTADLREMLRGFDTYTGSPQVRTLLQLSPLVFARPSELRLMKWAELDLPAAIWEKSGQDMKNGLDFVVPLSRQAVSLIEALRPFTGHHDFVFARNGRALSEGAIRKALERMGYKGRQTAHGFRHIASTRLNEMGFNRDWIERQLAHKDPNQTRAAYNKAQYLPQRAQMVQAWADYLDDLKK